MVDSHTRHWIYLYLVARDGEKCALADKNCKGKLVIDHIKGAEFGDDPTNLRLLCESHNRRRTNNSVSVSEKIESLKDSVDYQSGSAEMKVNEYAEPQWVAWVQSILRARGEMPRDDLVAGGALACQISVATSKRYLDKYGSNFKFAPFRVFKNEFRKWMVKLREPLDGGSGVQD